MDLEENSPAVSQLYQARVYLGPGSRSPLALKSAPSEVGFSPETACPPAPLGAPAPCSLWKSGLVLDSFRNLS